MPAPVHCFQSGLIVACSVEQATLLHRRLACLFPAMTIRLAYSLRAARAGLAELVPDILLLGNPLPDGEALDLLERLQPQTVLVLTRRGEAHVPSALRQGAAACLRQDQPEAGFMRQLQAVVESRAGARY